MLYSYSDFIREHKVFNPHAMSASLRNSLIPTLQGLGLPTPAYSRSLPWGYEKDPVTGCFFPIEKDLIIILTALEMANSKQYLIPDILDWIVAAAPSKTFERRTWFNIKKQRPPFPELRLPFEERVNLVYRLTTATS